MTSIRRLFPIGLRPSGRTPAAQGRRAAVLATLTAVAAASLLPATAPASPAQAGTAATAKAAPRTVASLDAGKPALVTTDPDAARGIHRAAVAARSVAGDSTIEKVDRAIARFRRNHPGYVAPRTTGGAAPMAELVAAAERSRRPDAEAGTECIEGWTTIQPANAPSRYVRPSDDASRRLAATGSAAVPYYNWFLPCRDYAGWTAGDYGLLANLGGKFVIINAFNSLLYAADTWVWDTQNLVRFHRFDGTYQDLWSPYTTYWIGTEGGGAYRLYASMNPLNGWGLYLVQPRPWSLPCDPQGPDC